MLVLVLLLLLLAVLAAYSIRNIHAGVAAVAFPSRVVGNGRG